MELQIIEKHNNVSYVIITPVDGDNNIVCNTVTDESTKPLRDLHDSNMISFLYYDILICNNIVYSKNRYDSNDKPLPGNTLYLQVCKYSTAVKKNEKPSRKSLQYLLQVSISIGFSSVYIVIASRSLLYL